MLKMLKPGNSEACLNNFPKSNAIMSYSQKHSMNSFYPGEMQITKHNIGKAFSEYSYLRIGNCLKILFAFNKLRWLVMR